MASVQQLSVSISCHAWNGDRTMIAVCPNNNDINIYSSKDWSKLYTLSNHDLLISAIDWCPISNKIVTCSHDRNAYVWNFVNENGSQSWKPSPVVLRIDRAALDVKWSADGLKFAVASGSKCVPVCTYEPASDWWVSKTIKKKIKSTVVCVAFHPTNGQLLATGSTDFKCRVYSTFTTDVDGTNVDAGVFGNPIEFGEIYAELTSLGWVNAVAWSPSGNVLAFAGHDSTVSFATFSPSGPTVRCIKLRDMPLSRLLFASEKVIVGGGYDFNPFLFTYSGGEWSYMRRLDLRADDNTSSAASSATGVAAARALFQNKTSRGQETKSTTDTLWTKHESAITCMSSCSPRGSKTVTKMSTTALDGKLVIWDLQALDVDMSLLSI